MAAKILVGRSARFATPEGRISYPNVLQPKQWNDDSDPKYSCSLMLAKDESDEVIDHLRELQEEAITEAFGKKAPRNFERWGIVDGDETEDPNYQGHWIIKASNKIKPVVVDGDKNDIFDSSEVYGGAYGRINLVGKAYGTASKGGVTFELLAVMVTRDGEAFGGAAAAMQAARDEF